MLKSRLYVAGDALVSAQAICQPCRALPGTPAGLARYRSRGCVSGTEARAGRRHPHDSDSRQARAVPRPTNRRRTQPDAISGAYRRGSHQVFLNLIVNAGQASGTITISTGAATAHHHGTRRGAGQCGGPSIGHASYAVLWSL
jgi:hypothetical protein